VRILDRKGKGSVCVQTDAGKEYLALDNAEEAEYLKYAVHLMSNDLSKAIYTREAFYLFVEKTGDKITFEGKNIPDDGEAKVEINDFFESRATVVFEDTDVPAIRKSLLSDKRFLLVMAVMAVVVCYYGTLKCTAPEIRHTGSATPSAPVSLSDSDKKTLKVIASKLVASKIAEIISSVRPDSYQRIASLTAQIEDTPLSVLYTVNISKEYLYPEVGSVSKEKGTWGKPETVTKEMRRNDIKPLRPEDFEACSLQMLNSGYYVDARKEDSVDFTYEDDAMKTIANYESVMNCNVSLKSLSVNSGKGKVDVTLYR